jgi:hypothetical protein
MGKRVELFDVAHNFRHGCGLEVDIARHLRDNVQFSERRVGLDEFLLEGDMREEEVIDAAILLKGRTVEELVEEVLVALVLHFEFQVVFLLVHAVHS